MLLRILRLLQWVMVGLAVMVLSHLTIKDAAADEWQVISELPTQRSEFSTAVVDGKIYLIGGTLFKNENGPFGMSLVEVYDPQANTWERVADIPTARSEPMTAVVAGEIYVLGGYVAIDNRGVNLKILDVVEVYNPHANIWEKKKEMPTPRFQFGIGTVAGKIYAIGGSNFFENPWRFDLVEVYDPVSNRWAKRADMPTVRDSVGTAVVSDTIYAIGGSGWPPTANGGPSLGTIEVYEPRINRWTKKPDMPNLRAVFSTVVVSGKIYLIGSPDEQAGGEPALIEVYDPITERWRAIPTTPTVEHPFGAAAVNGKIYVFGGYTEDWEFSADVEVFDTGFRAVTAIGKSSVQWGKLKAVRQSQP